MPTTQPAKSSSNGCLIVIIVFLLLIVAGIAGLYVMNSFQIPMGIPKLSVLSGLPSLPGMNAARVKESDFSFIDDPLIRKHFVAQANQTAFRVKTKANIGKDGSLQVSEMELKGETMSLHSWQEESGKKQAEMIMIGDTTYVKDQKDGSWWKQTVKPEKQKEMEGEMEIQTEDFKDEYTKDRKLTYKKLGEEACGGLTCYKYEEGDPENKEANRIFWFDTKKLLLRKEESGFGEWRGMTEYEYEDISVKVPSPTKDVPEGRNVYEYMYAGEMPIFAEPLMSAPKTKTPPPDSFEPPPNYTDYDYDASQDYTPEDY